MTDPVRGHWEGVYGSRDTREVSWYEAVPHRSLEWIEAVAPAASDPRIIDVGAGASTLVDHLLDRGYRRLTLLDVAAPALSEVRTRLGARADAVEWVVADLLDFADPEPFDLWHDRAVLHFLLDPEEQRRYGEVLRRSVRPGGHAVIAAFAVGGPARCSGLDTMQYDAPRIARLAGAGFTLLRDEREVHRTPGGGDQLFAWFLLRRDAER